MRNYNVYLKGMSKALEEKLFFLHILDLKWYDTIIDFGCGGGEILAACANSKARLIGIDHDPIMRDLTHQRVPSAELYAELSPDFITPNTLIIFSSVLHEVEDYWYTLEKMLKGSGCTIVVRDMRFSGTNRPLYDLELAKLIRHTGHIYLADFTLHYGMKTLKDMYHYLLKYSYVDNWKLEVEEDYFSFDYNRLFALGNVLYEKNYTLLFKQDRVLNDFDILLTQPTHVNLIIKVNKDEQTI